MRFAVSAIVAAFACACVDASTATPLSIGSAPEWRITQSPRLSIGAVDGDDRYALGYVVGALRLRGGEVVIAGGDPFVGLYDSLGTFVRRVGGRGMGPGEFRYLVDPPMAYRADSFALWDLSQRRVNVFDSKGAFARSAVLVAPMTRLEPGSIPSQSCCRVQHAFSDGSFLLEFPAMIPNRPGPDRYAHLALSRVSTDGSRVDTIGWFDDQLHSHDVNAPNRVRALRLSWPFSYTLVGDTIIGGNGAGQWLVRIAPGSKPDTIRLSGATVRVTDSLKAAHAQAYRAAREKYPARFERGPIDDLFSGPYVEVAPAYTGVYSDAEGNVWLSQWKLPFSETPWEFHVYTTRGQPVARIKLPAQSMIAYIAADHVALIQSDSLDVKSLRLYDIIRSR